MSVARRRTANQIAKPALRGVDEAFALGIVQVMDHRRVGLAKGLNLAPGVISRNLAFVKSMVERRPQDGE